MVNNSAEIKRIVYHLPTKKIPTVTYGDEYNLGPDMKQAEKCDGA